MDTMSMQGVQAGLEPESLESFKNNLRGQLLIPGEAAYEEARSVWNAMIDRRPALIARCLGVGDVAASVNFARTSGLPLTIKGGGHNIAGLAASDGGLMIDMSLNRGVWVDPVKRTAHAQAGCILGDLDRETQLHGLAAVIGFISKTGIAGLTLGGGFGYLTRRFGWSCDNVRSMQVVTVDGRLVRASEQENADLFWGLRGGGGNFGVVTDFEYQLYPVGPQIVGGAIAWRADDAPAVAEMFRTFVEQSAPEVTSMLVLRKAPPAPWLAKEVHGQPIVMVIVCHTGPIEQAERDVAPIKNFGSPVGDVIQRRSYVSQQTLMDATQPKGRRYYWKSEYLPKFEPDMLAEVIRQAKVMASPHSTIAFMDLDGVMDQLPEDHCAMGNRNAAAVINIQASWENPQDDAVNIEWARETWSRIRRFSTGGVYVNFLSEDESGDRIRAAYGNNYDRLVDIKTKWDPQNLFRVNKNIVPRSAEEPG